jgi:hypothetical protein
VSSGGLAHEQENPEVHEGVGIANQSGPIGFFLESTTSSNSYSSPIARARPQHPEEAPEPPIQPLRSLYAETSLPWPSRLSSPRITVKNTSPVIFHPLQSLGKLLRHPRNLVTVEYFLPPNPVHRGNSLSAYSPLQSRLSQGFP